MQKIPFVFFDRDDTLIYDVPYLNDPEKVRLIPGAADLLKALHEAGFKLALVSNQSGIGRGLVTLEQLAAVNARMQEMLVAAGGVALDAIFFCPHHPDEHCKCRKPGTGMLEQACEQFNVDVPHSFMVGDLPGDIKMGRDFGLKTVQLMLPGLNKKDGGADIHLERLLDALPYLLGKENL